MTHKCPWCPSWGSTIAMKHHHLQDREQAGQPIRICLLPFSPSSSAAESAFPTHRAVCRSPSGHSPCSPYPLFFHQPEMSCLLLLSDYYSSLRPSRLLLITLNTLFLQQVVTLYSTPIICAFHKGKNSFINLCTSTLAINVRHQINVLLMNKQEYRWRNSLYRKRIISS